MRGRRDRRRRVGGVPPVLLVYIALRAAPTSRPMIPVFTPWLPESARRYVLDCVDTGWISSLGEYVPRFEAELARFCEARHAVATANGTVALHLALAVLGLGPA